MGRRGFIGLFVLALAACGSSPPAGDDDLEVDARPVDATPDLPYTATPPGCADLPADLYVTPATLPADRGAIVRCIQGAVLDVAAVTAAAEEAGATIEATTGVSVVKLAYRTVRSDGTPAVTTAVAWLPLEPRALPAPVALVARSTSGIADACAPTRSDLPLAELGLPLAARGFVAIAPDFAGLGNEGVHAYLDNREAANQLFDGARALRALVGSSIGDPVTALGYSQGGGIVLSAQALEHAITGARTLRGVVAIAPEWPTRVGAFGYDDLLRDPDRITGTTGLAPPTVTALRQYGWFANRLGAGRAGDSFPAAERAQIVDSIESLCTVELGAALGANQVRVRELVDESFRVAMLACIDGTAGCVEPAASFHAWMLADVVTADPAGARVLVVQGLGDQVMPAASQAACDVAKLRADGVTPEVCSDTFGTHDSVLERKIEHAAAWAEAAATCAATPTCSSAFLPACMP
jgi:predicted esterase